MVLLIGLDQENLILSSLLQGWRKRLINLDLFQYFKCLQLLFTWFSLFCVETFSRELVLETLFVNHLVWVLNY